MQNESFNLTERRNDWVVVANKHAFKKVNIESFEKMVINQGGVVWLRINFKNKRSQEFKFNNEPLLDNAFDDLLKQMQQ